MIYARRTAARIPSVIVAVVLAFSCGGVNGPTSGVSAANRDNVSGAGVPGNQQGYAPVEGWASHYGESYNGQPMGCSGAGPYSSDDPTIAAIGPAFYDAWPCGTVLRVCARVVGDGGAVSPVREVPCILVQRTDSCPGCYPNTRYVIDLSEAGISALGCVDVCPVTVERID